MKIFVQGRKVSQPELTAERRSIKLPLPLKTDTCCKATTTPECGLVVTNVFQFEKF